MAMVGVNSLTPQQAAERAERWFGARVDYRTTGKIKIYPKDPEQPMIVISDRWSNGHDRLNAVKRLQRAGLDVINGQTPPGSKLRSDGRSIDPHLTQKLPIPAENREDPPVTTSANGNHQAIVTPAAMPAKPPAGHSDYETVLGMLAEAEQRDKERRGEISTLESYVRSLAQTVDQLSARVMRLDELEHQNRGRYAALSKRVKAAEDRMNRAGQAPMSEAERAERERAELTEKAIALLQSLPPAAAMTAGSIAASIDMPSKGHLVGRLLTAAAKEGRVVAVKVGGGVQMLYRALPREENA